jgi:hypothetical protein
MTWNFFAQSKTDDICYFFSIALRTYAEVSRYSYMLVCFINYFLRLNPSKSIRKGNLAYA